MIRALALAIVGAVLVLVSPAAHAECQRNVEYGSAYEECHYLSAADIDKQKSESPTSTWSVTQICKDGGRTPEGVCFNPQECTTAAGVPGTRYTVFKDGENVGTACLSANEADAVDDPPPIRALVLEAFKRLDWPASDIVIQPPNGKTLVNLETNFYTSNTDATDIAVRLVQSNVVVSASPIAYRWHFGDGTSVTTTSPGAPYPDLDVSHVYEQTDEVAVSVDTQYGDASFTVDGGPPEAIPSTIWVVGAEADLEIVEAIPQLVIR